MKGDFTRDTFQPAKHFSRVLMQQGRVTLDADFNEQAAISLRYLRTMARDIIGPYAAPAGKDAKGHDLGGFKLTKLDPDPDKTLFRISKGCYYVDGILVENETDDCTYKKQPDYQPPADDPLLKAPAGERGFFVYLDVWERHITPIDDDSIREKALGGPDTCTRAKVVWQVKALPLTEKLENEMADAEKNVFNRLHALWTEKAKLENDIAKATTKKKQVHLLIGLLNLDEQLARRNHLALLPTHKGLLRQLVRLSNAKLAARVDPGQKTEDACVTPPASKYRGAENQLYRVEIHRGSRDEKGNSTTPTFKWSRDNGSVVTAWLGGEGSDLHVESVRGFAAGNWVELLDDDTELLGKPAGTLVQLVKVEGDTLSVDPATVPQPPGTGLAIGNYPKNPKVRRWDHIATDAISLANDNAMPIQESSPTGATPEKIVWIDLEDGVQVQFSAGGEYRTGDYWLIPARVPSGNVEWPQADELNPQPLPPRGIEHHYALLGIASRANANRELTIKDARFEFWPLMSRVVESTLSGTADYQPVQPTPADYQPVQPVGPAPYAAPSKTVPAPKKPPKARKRQAKKSPASRAEGAPS
jgi:hypothetical protein